MEPWGYFILGVAVSAPLCIALTWRAARRLRTNSRHKDSKELVELAQLAGGLAHEIKNPLSTINVNLKLLSEDLARYPDEDHKRWLRRLTGVQEESDRLKGILEDFLRYAGKYELSLVKTDIRQLIDELVDFFSPQADAARVVLRASLSDSPIMCKVDSNMLKQAVLNLAINAVQAMPDGGELLVKASSNHSEASIEVIDTGTGIDPKEAKNIFTVYHSTKKGGSGLGLPTTQRIVREHHGSINVDSEPGKGTRFTITLPLAKD